MDALAAIAAWDCNRETQRWFDWPLADGCEDVAIKAPVVRDKWAAWREGTELAFLIRDPVSGTVFGHCDLTTQPPQGPVAAEIAYLVLPEHRGHGVANGGSPAPVPLRVRRPAVAERRDPGGRRQHRIPVGPFRVGEVAGFHVHEVLRDHGRYERHQPMIGTRYDVVVYRRFAEAARVRRR
jgi:hypothetical protein